MYGRFLVAPVDIRCHAVALATSNLGGCRSYIYEANAGLIASTGGFMLWMQIEISV